MRNATDRRASMIYAALCAACYFSTVEHFNYLPKLLLGPAKKLFESSIWLIFLRKRDVERYLKAVSARFCMEKMVAAFKDRC